MKNLERHRNTPSEEGNINHPRGQPRRSAAGSKSRHLFNEKTNNTENNDSPGERMKGSASFSQLAGNVSRMRQAQRSPLVRYDGVVEDSKATSTHAHREVKVIVHRSTSSSSSSTVSSLRSVEQRMASPRSKHVQSHDHIHHHRRRHQNSERSEIQFSNHMQSGSSCTVEKLSDLRESTQLQVVDVVEDATHSENFCGTSQKTIEEGGSLAAMFDS